MNASRKRNVWLLGAGAALIASAAVVAVFARSHSRAKDLPEAQARADEREGSGPPTPVKAVHPSKNPSLRMTVQQLLSVEPFFEAELRTQVAGRVVRVPKSLGASVREGDLLVEIAVPDLDQEVSEKAAVIRQRQKDVELAKAQIGVADAQVAVASALKEQREYEVKQAEQTREYRRILAARLKKAAALGGINETVADEAERDYQSARFAVFAAEAAVHKADADIKEKVSILAAARADVELKEALVQVSRKDHAQAVALDGYARITAPFDGVITEHNVVEGTFVQNASTAHTEPMLTLARTDIVTVVMKVPDNYVRYVTRDTEAVLQFDELPSVEMHGRVTRFSPSIRNRDRTMRVEVDIWNDTPANYQKFAAKCVSTWLAPMAGPGALDVAALTAGSGRVWNKNSKDRTDPFPVLPVVTGNTEGPVSVLPGMSGYMRLNLRQFKNAYVLPSSAVYTRGGKPYILAVRDGKSRQLAVRVQVNDGRWAQVAIVVQEGDALHDKPEVLKPLTGDETIILNRQVEIGDRQPVEVTLDEP
jgi:multidrug efflux pump subunit AcrA (membrane-fusion protein)